MRSGVIEPYGNSVCRDIAKFYTNGKFVYICRFYVLSLNILRVIPKNVITNNKLYAILIVIFASNRLYKKTPVRTNIVIYSMSSFEK